MTTDNYPRKETPMFDRLIAAVLSVLLWPLAIAALFRRKRT